MPTTTTTTMRAVLALAVVASVACANAPRDAADSSSASTASEEPRVVNAANALDLSQVMTADYVAAHGSCIPTAATPARSRLLHVLIPDQSSYLRLNVVTSADGSRAELIDLARGIGGRRIWYATIERGGATMRTETFANQGDKQPVVAELPLTDAAAQRLQQLARGALALPCGTRS